MGRRGMSPCRLMCLFAAGLAGSRGCRICRPFVRDGLGRSVKKTAESYGTTAFFQGKRSCFLKKCGLLFNKSDLPGDEAVSHAFSSVRFSAAPCASLVRKKEGQAAQTSVEGGDPFSQICLPSPHRGPLRLLPNQPGGNKRLKQYDARSGGKVDAADFAFDGDADMMRREPDLFGRQP